MDVRFGPKADIRPLSCYPCDMADQRFLSARVDGSEAPVSAYSASVPWWSFTKTALATVALQLVAQGHLSLDDLIDSRPYTLRQLLQHRAGVPDYSGLAAYHEAIRQGDTATSAESSDCDRAPSRSLDWGKEPPCKS